MDILVLKWLHICSAMLLFGTGLGTAFFKFSADLSRDPRVIAYTNRRVVLADWLFTTPTIMLQPWTGYWLVQAYGYPPTAPWLLASYALFVLAGLCWLPVVWLQIRMRDDSAAALAAGAPLGERYWRDARLWFWLGIPAFISMVAVLYLMTVKPAFTY
jgi:uncharacterized membrane protein